MQLAKSSVFTLAALILASTFALSAEGKVSGGPKIVAVHNGSITLHALLWRPPGRGPFPAVMLNHGSGRTREDLERLGPYERQADALGPVFARHGYVTARNSPPTPRASIRIVGFLSTFLYHCVSEPCTGRR